ncbi:translation elongation factor 2 (EF-2/EF-G) [Balneicella halophila]|uniref:Elongation factor G n=1 Tax=Balneicella halophila TaxID=1537566 RepID=A0A7L4UR88_BALHA|nr:elongation factor G [Balneicella halophila]PVX52285.1 translation elongation factor 2 (EF-2/EF-G) [Balneicella halophila]
MKIYKPEELRNIALIGASGAGKTTLAECMMHEGGVIPRRGSVEDKNTVSDYFPVEHDYGNSVFSTVLYTTWDGNKINVIDTPGMPDFIDGAVAALNVCAVGLMVINAKHGAEVGAEIMSRHAKRLNKPMVFAINKLDDEKANFEQTIEECKVSFGKNKIAIVQFPIEVGENFNEVVDVLEMKLYRYDNEGKLLETIDVPDEHKEKAEELHNELVEKAAENDESLMELYFEKGSLTEDEMREGIKKGMLDRELYPVFCTSAEKSMGVRRLMRFANNVFPSPAESIPAQTTSGDEVPCDVNGKTSLFIFKTSIEPHLGEVSYFKVMSGVVKEGQDLINSANQGKERLSQLYIVAGRNREKVSELQAGDIGATVKLKNTKNGHALNEKGFDVEYPPIKYPEPKFRTAIRPVDESNDERLGELLSRYHEEDPTLIVEYSKELKQILVYGQGEYHLNTMKWRLKNNEKLDIEFHPPKIPYRETITKLAAADYRHKKQSGGAGQFGEVHLLIEPYEEGMPDPSVYKIDGKEIKVNLKGTDVNELKWGGKLVFCNCIVGGVIDTRFLPAIQKGIMEKMEEGPLTGSYARDIRVCVYDGKMHPVDSNELSFMLAGRKAFSAAFKQAGPKILEPIYDVSVLVPEDRMGDVMSDLQTRRAMIMGMESESGFQKLNARVPLAEIGKYSTALSSLTGGRASFTLKFAEYEKVPGDVQEELLKKYEAEQDEE